MVQWSELGIWIRKTRVQIPDSDYWMDLSSVILGANSPRFVNSQLVCLLPVGILNWERGEGDFNIMILKSPFRGVIIKDLLLLLLLELPDWVLSCYKGLNVKFPLPVVLRMQIRCGQSYSVLCKELCKKLLNCQVHQCIMPCHTGQLVAANHVLMYWFFLDLHFIQRNEFYICVKQFF